MPHGWTRLCVYCTTLHLLLFQIRGDAMKFFKLCSFRKTLILIAANDPIFYWFI